MSANSVLAKMAVQISANNTEFARAMTKSQKDLSSFTGGLTKMAGALGVAFSVQQIADFALEISKLAGEAEGVSAAFERLPESTKLMSELKDATGGTVSELSLMKRAVQASNFDISLKALPRLLEFATLRAQQTGQSVDYLVDSIVTGIGRKSKLILDNLGISALQLDKALGGVSIAAASVGEVAEAVGTIAEDNLTNMAGFAENASTKIQRLSASWEDLKVAMGNAANSSGVLGKTTNMLTKFFNVLAGDEFTTGFNQLLSNGGRASEILERFAAAGGKIDLSWQELLARGFVRTEAAAKKYEKILRDITTTQQNLAMARDASSSEIDPATGLPTKGGKRWDPSLSEKHIESLSSLEVKEKALLEVFKATDEADKEKLQNTADQIHAVRDKIKAIEDLLKAEKTLAAHTLSQTSQRALGGQALTGVSPLAAGGLSFANVNTEAIEERMRSLRVATGEATEAIAQDFMDMSGIVAGSLSNLAQGLGAAIAGTEDFGEALLHTIGGFMQSFGSSLIAMGIGKIALDAFSGPAMIAAGFALTAAGSAISASVSRGPNLSNGGGSNGPGRTPSEMQLNISGRTRGYDLVYTTEKESYRRGRFA